MTPAGTPRRPLALVVVLVLVGLAAAAAFVMTLAISQSITGPDGTTREVPMVERLTNDLGAALGSLGFSVTAALAAVSLWMRRPWGIYPAVAVGAGAAWVSAMLLSQAAREWGMEGSFSPLLVPPGVLCAAIAALVVIAAVRARRELYTGERVR